MGESLKNEAIVREYLLGRVSDETTLEGIEELLFTDEEFCSQVALAEDDLINAYVLGNLNEVDAESFRATLAGNPERRFKLELTQAIRERALQKHLKAEDKPSLFASLKAFFRQPMYAGAFAMMLIALVGLGIYLSRRSGPDELAELRSIYQQARPTESRITEFGYAPLPQLRGAPEPAEQSRLRLIENRLIEANEKNPNAQTHHALGVFYLTQRNYPEAIKELQNALKLADKNAQIHNDLGVAHFELAKSGPKEKKLEELANSLEEFTKATELDGNLLEALFNKSLALEELGSPRQAKESWNLYLQKDPSSRWADEARKHLGQLASEQRLFKSDETVLSDFLKAYRQQDYPHAQKIHNETKGSLKTINIALQLSRRYLEAKQRGDGPETKESLDALNYLGSFEQDQNGDSFFFELAKFYATLDASKIGALLKAKDMFAAACRSIGSDNAQTISQFEQTRVLFAQVGDSTEAGIAEILALQFLADLGKLSESFQRLAQFIASAESRNFKILLAAAHYWLAISEQHRNQISESIRELKLALSLAETSNNAFEVQHLQETLTSTYSDLGEFEPALFYASKMLNDRDLYYQNHRQYWREKGTLGDVALKLQFFSAALNLAQERLSIVQETDPGSSLINDSLADVGSAAVARGDFAGALKYASESMQVARERGESAENTRTMAGINVQLADLKSKMGDCNGALSDYNQALKLYQALPEVTDGLYRVHRGRLFCFEQLDQRDDFANELTIVMKLSEEYRATIREDDARQAFFASEQPVFDAAAANAIREHRSRDAFALVEASKARSLLDFVESGKSIAEVEETFGPVAKPLALTEIQTRLPEQVQVVQYAVLPDRLAIWIISRTRFDFVEKTISANDLENRIEAYQAAIVGKSLPADLRQAAQDLYGLLIPTDLESGKQLCLVPDKSLHRLAFATLVSPAGKYLLEDYALLNAPSSSVLVLASENARHKEQVADETVLSIGNPDFNREENPNLPDLRDAAAEAKAIAADYAQARDLIGPKATRKTFLLNLANVEVIHFAGHFVANQQSPGNSKLLFAGGDLRTNELSAFKLPRAKLFVMSACETGFERYSKGEGAIGIARTLLALGAPMVLASQWKVDSEPTKDLMIAFHRNRKQRNLASAESLRQAQLELLSKDGTRAPFYWAAFALFGGYANY